MTVQTNFFPSGKNEIKLFKQSWTAVAPVADVVLIHGYTDHSGRYEVPAKALNEQKINVHTFDLRGHGKSEGLTAYVSSFDEYLDDLHHFIQQLKAVSGNVFLLGHSMGGLIAAKYLLKHPETKCKGVILSSPALKQKENTPPALIKISMLLSFLWPKLTTSIKLDTQFLSRDQQVIDNYVNDPLVYKKGAKARFLGELMKSMNTVQEQFPSFHFPVLILHSSIDKLTNPKGSELMMNSIQSTDKTFKLIPNLYHELLHEPEKEEIVNTIVSWIKDRL
jgi:acylglycerol lipase